MLGVANSSGAYVEVYMKYSQGWPALANPTGDGPYNFQVGERVGQLRSYADKSYCDIERSGRQLPNGDCQHYRCRS